MSASRAAPPLWTLANREPDDLAIDDGRRALTWEQLDRETTAFGHGLEAHGLEPGDHVAVVARNHVEFLVAVIAIQRAGMVVTPVKTGWTPSEILYLLEDAGSRAVVTDIESAREAAAQAHIATIDLERDYAVWIDAQSVEPLPYDRNGWRLSYTSGTTGRPKGVVRADAGTQPFSEAFVASAAFASALRIPRDGIHLVVSGLAVG